MNHTEGQEYTELPRCCTAAEPAKGYLEEETDIHQGTGKVIGFISAWLSDKTWASEKLEAVPTTKAEDYESREGGWRQ